MVGNGTQWDENEEDIEPGREEEVAIAGDPARLAVSDDESTNALGKGEPFARRLGVVDTVVAAGTIAGEEGAVLRGRWHCGWREERMKERVLENRMSERTVVCAALPRLPQYASHDVTWTHLHPHSTRARLLLADGPSFQTSG